MFELASFVSSQPRGEQHGGVVRSRDLHTPVSQAEPALLNDFIVLDLVGRFFAARFAKSGRFTYRASFVSCDIRVTSSDSDEIRSFEKCTGWGA